MNVFTVSFFGHRTLHNSLWVEKELQRLINEFIVHKEYVEFLVGRDGEFDQLVSSVVRRCKRTIRDDNSTLVLVMPYATAEYRNNTESFHDYYDEVEVCSESASKHFKAAHQSRNCSMVNRSDLAVFYLDHNSGGAYTTMRYAEKSGTRIINLAEVNSCCFNNKIKKHPPTATPFLE